MTDTNNPPAITPEIVQEWAIDIKEVMACYLPEMEEAVPFLLKENLKLHEENQRLQAIVDVQMKALSYCKGYAETTNRLTGGCSDLEERIDEALALTKPATDEE